MLAHRTWSAQIVVRCGPATVCDLEGVMSADEGSALFERVREADPVPGATVYVLSPTHASAPALQAVRPALSRSPLPAPPALPSCSLRTACYVHPRAPLTACVLRLGGAPPGRSPVGLYHLWTVRQARTRMLSDIASAASPRDMWGTLAAAAAADPLTHELTELASAYGGEGSAASPQAVHAVATALFCVADALVVAGRFDKVRMCVGAACMACVP